MIPWDDLVKLLPEKKNPAGAPSYLPRAGYFGLMFLKHYTGLSDEKLIAAFQNNFAYQMFRGCRLKVGEVTRDNAFASHNRSYLAKYCDMSKVQKVLIEAWKGKLENTNVLMMEATRNGIDVTKSIYVFQRMSNYFGNHVLFFRKSKFLVFVSLRD